MAAKPIKSLELHYTMIQFLIIFEISDYSPAIGLKFFISFSNDSRKIARVSVTKEIAYLDSYSQVFVTTVRGKLKNRLYPAWRIIQLWLSLVPVHARYQGRQNGSCWTASLSHRPSRLFPVPSRTLSEENSKDQGELQAQTMCVLSNNSVKLNREECDRKEACRHFSPRGKLTAV